MDFLIAAAGSVGLASLIVGAVVKLCFSRIEKKMDEEKAARERAEHNRRAYELYQVKMLTATAGLCEANAIALQNGKCNGETHKALSRLQEVKQEQRDFLVSQGIDHLF